MEASVVMAGFLYTSIVGFYFADDDGDGAIDEDLANPPRSNSAIYPLIFSQCLL